MKLILIPITIAILFSTYSCKKDNVEISYKGLLKYKYWYWNSKDSFPDLTYEYLYDSHARLERINYIGKDIFEYESFLYDTNNQLKTKLWYSYANDSVSTLIGSWNYNYENNLLVLDEVYYPFPNDYTVTSKYDYENSKIVRKDIYTNQQFSSSTIYDYENNVCTKESLFNDYELTHLVHYFVHYYEENFLMKSELYHLPQNVKIQVISYTHDTSGKLITEEGNKTEWEVVKRMEYLYKYEYY